MSVVYRRLDAGRTFKLGFGSVNENSINVHRSTYRCIQSCSPLVKQQVRKTVIHLMGYANKCLKKRRKSDGI